MTFDEILTRELMSDIAKGRYNRQKVREIMDRLCGEVAHEVERTVFEYAMLQALQCLHYEFGFGNKRLQRFFDELSKAIAGFDAGAYDMEDMRMALADDAKFEFEIRWGDDHE